MAKQENEQLSDELDNNSKWKYGGDCGGPAYEVPQDLFERVVNYLRTEQPQGATDARVALLRNALQGVASDCQLAIDALGNSGPEFGSVERGLAIIRDRAREALAKFEQEKSP